MNIDLSDVVVVPPQPKGEKKFPLQWVDHGVYAIQIDNSSLEVMMTCPKKFFYQVILGRNVPPSSALILGRTVHTGLEEWYREPQRSKDDELLFMHICQKMMESWEQPYDDPNEWRSLDRAVDTLSLYRHHYPAEPFEVLDVEKKFSLPLGEIEVGQTSAFTNEQIVAPGYPEELRDQPIHLRKLLVFWTGMIDILAEEHGRLWIWDHKTSSVLGSNYFDGFELANQTLGYTWAGSQIEEEPIFGFGLNVLVIRKKTRTGTANEFHRRRFNYPRHRIDEFPHNTMRLMETMVHYLVSDDFPKQSTWCISKYMQKCPFFDVCSLPPAERPALLFAPIYVDNTWSPLNE